MRHLLGLSGGKDSAALALYMKDKVPNMEYYFCDTHAELPETYEYLQKLQSYLGKEIVYLSSGGFDYHLKHTYKDFLPSPRARWCTNRLKIMPFKEYVGSDNVVSYIGLRADENRAGYFSTKQNIKPMYPFIMDGLEKKDIFQIVDDSGLGLPKYYQWRSRSGCYFCFFQRKIEWVRLLEIHPDLFEKAIEYEKYSAGRGKKFTWNQKESLQELRARKDQIINRHEKKMMRKKAKLLNRYDVDIFESVLNDENDAFCVVCDL